MTRRTTGGSVRHHATRNLWEARYTGSDGRRHSVYAPTERQAQERLRAALSAADHGIRPVGMQRTTGSYLAEWVDTSVRQRCRPRTAESYADTVTRYLVPAIGRVPLAKLEPEHVRRMLADLAARGTLSATTLRYIRSVLRTALGQALREGKVLRNVAALVDPPAKSQREIRPLSREQVRVFLDGIAGDRLEALYLVALGTGLRQGEALALRWQDVDLERGELTVRHTLQRFTRELAPTKTERSRRTIRLPRRVVEALAAHRERQRVVPLSGLIFTSSAGAPLQSVNATRDLQLHLRRLGLPHQRFHDLRHAFATLALEAGEVLGVVSRILGHSTLSTTMDIYGHLTPAMLDRAAERMDAVLGG